MLSHQRTIFMILVNCRGFPIEKVNYTWPYPLNPNLSRLYCKLANNSYKYNFDKSGSGKPDVGVDPIPNIEWQLQIEGKADRTAIISLC